MDIIHGSGNQDHCNTVYHVLTHVQISCSVLLERFPALYLLSRYTMYKTAWAIMDIELQNTGKRNCSEKNLSSKQIW